MNEVEEMMRNMNLPGKIIRSVIGDQGYDNLHDLLALPLAEWEEVAAEAGMKRNHRKKFINALTDSKIQRSGGGIHHQHSVDETAPPQTQSTKATRAFCSLRFDGVVPEAAASLKDAMAAEFGVELIIINMAGGGDIDKAVQEGILRCDTFIVFGSAKYGEETGNAACTYYEIKFAQNQQKHIILLRMIPFHEAFEFSQAKFIFGLNKLELPYMLGEPMPVDLPRQVFKAMGLDDGAQMPQGTIAETVPRSKPVVEVESPGASRGIRCLAELSVATEATTSDLLQLSETELNELLQEIKVGVLGRKSIEAEVAIAKVPMYIPCGIGETMCMTFRQTSTCDIKTNIHLRFSIYGLDFA